jgi:thiamine-monophosphate kinase
MNADRRDRLLGQVGERKLVAEVLGHRYNRTLSFGDDCAVVPELPAQPFELVATTDPCPEPLVASLALEWQDLYYQGWLLGTINFSDLAAAGAEPLGLMVSYLLPGELTVGDFERLMDGVDECCAKHGSQIIGGNVGDGHPIQLTATAIGACRAGRRMGRHGAVAGDSILLVGSPGYLWSAALLKRGYAQLPATEAQLVYERALRPVAQLAAGRALAEAGLAHAAIDVSDGLYPSVEALCAMNRIGAVVDADVPILDALPREVCQQAKVDPFAMAQLWGDWTLVVAVDGGAARQVISMLDAIGVPCREIGSFREGGQSLLRRDGELITWSGVDAERFTESSWNRSKLSDYLAGLVGSAPELG